jgi:hypothetical protein
MASGLTLPGGLVTFLNDLGYIWPDADEVRLTQLGQAWIDLQATLQGHLADADRAASAVWTHNTGKDIAAFQQFWSQPDGAVDTLATDVTGVAVVGAVILVAAAVVLALKIWVIAQLVILAIAVAQAIATAPLTFGASLLEIPVFKEIAGRILNLAISQAIAVLLG